MVIGNRHLGVVAHVIGSVAALTWVVSGLASVSVGEVTSDRLPEAAALAALVLSNVAGVVLARFNERRGGVVLIVAGSALCVFALFAAGRNEVLSAIVSGGPFLMSGLLLTTRRS